MNSDVGDLLREGIDRATAGERIPPGLAGRARQRHHRRAFTIRAAAVTGTAAVTAAAVVAAVTGGTPPRGGGPVLTTAYVAGHTEQALAAAGRGGLIYRVSWAGPEEYAVAAEPMVSGHPSTELHLNSLKIARTTTWFYQGRTRTEGYAADGQVAIDIGPSTPTRSRGPQAPPDLIAVDPHTRQWFHPLTPFDVPYSSPPVPHSCNTRDDWLVGGPLSSAEFAALARKSLSCGQFRADGQQQVNGARALRLAGTPQLLRQLRGDEWGRTGPRAVTLWVNATTFLPVRVTVSGWKIPDRKSTDFSWLKPTAANLAMLRVNVPAGTHEVQLPAGSLLLTP